MAFRHQVQCYICNVALRPQAMVRLGNADDFRRDIAIHRRDDLQQPALAVDDETRICLNCNKLMNREIAELEEDPECIRLNVLRQTSSTTCFICNALAVNLNRLTVECRIDIFLKKNIFVPPATRCCHNHLNADGHIPVIFHQTLRFLSRPYRLKGQELSQFLHKLRDVAIQDEPNFTRENLSEDEFQCISGIRKDQFRELLSFCEPVPIENDRHRYISEKYLLTFMCKLRQGLSDDFLKVIFKYSCRQDVSRAINLVRQSLMIRFVPENIGLNAINRERYIKQHVTEFSNTLYNPEVAVPRAIAYIDGTYSYIPKSSNFRSLRQSYCVHKDRHLVKPALVVAPDGYILDIHGPYFSDGQNNDANMVRNEFENDRNGLREWFREGDILIVDRGYRDAIPLLEDLGINCQMPPLLQHGRRQFNTDEANESRLITKTRWIVEARNGHIKSIFKFFQNVIPMSHVPHLGDFYRTAGALINRYRDPIHMDGANAALAQELLRKSRMPNAIQQKVEDENLHTRNARWNRLNHNHAPRFPRLDLDYLQELTVGIYQVNLASSYVQDKLQREATDVFEFDELGDEPGLIRVRVYSRFRKYQLWIKHRFEENLMEHDNGDNDPIVGYYCTCKSGARTLGSCAHVASVIWFLGYARFEDDVKYPSSILLDTIMDAGDRPR